MNRGDPFLDLHREMNRLFDDTLRGMSGGASGQGAMMGVPRIDVREAGDNLEITATAWREPRGCGSAARG
jgi:HSP20 family protein